MNTDTGAIYRGDDIAKAIGRGEPVVEVSETVARKMETMNYLLAQAKSLADEIEAMQPASPLDTKPGELLALLQPPVSVPVVDGQGVGE